jgi:hypothetical protein
MGPVQAFNKIGDKKTDCDKEGDPDDRQNDLRPYRCNKILFHKLLVDYREISSLNVLRR